MSSNNIVPFAFGESLVRIMQSETGDPLFIAKDVALALDYEWNGAPRIAHIPEEWKGVTSVVTPSGTQDMLFLTEQGLYFFLGRSDKAKALPFQKWLAGEVVPSIRQTGSYMMSKGGLQNDNLTDGSVTGMVLPEAALRLKPLMRDKALSYAIQTVRLEGGGSQERIDYLFARYCEMLTLGWHGSPHNNPHVVLPGVPLSMEQQRAFVMRFAENACHTEKGKRLRSSEVYEAFRLWWRQETKASLPSQKIFGTVMREYYPARRKGGTYYYYNIALCEEVTP